MTKFVFDTKCSHADKPRISLCLRLDELIPQSSIYIVVVILGIEEGRLFKNSLNLFTYIIVCIKSHIFNEIWTSNRVWSAPSSFLSVTSTLVNYLLYVKI